MPATVTYTGDVGPGIEVTAAVYTGVTRIDLQWDAKVAFLYFGDRVKEISLAGITTYTDTIVGDTHTITIS